MSKIKQNPIRYYDISDIYAYEVDNRPIADVASNIDLINTQLSNLGFYSIKSSNSATEPPGGFSPYTCAYVGPGDLLYPIDISQPISIIDYSKYPIYLILNKSKDPFSYECLTFSASITINSLYNSFLPTSIGKGLKIGPGGSLVDEIYFDLYFSGNIYQNILVGKVLTSNTISFGGNQVSTLTDNRFILKNRDDVTSGVIATYKDNSANSVVCKGVLNNTSNNPYPFVEYQNYVGQQTSLISSPVPVYFSNQSISFDSVTGQFTVTSLNSILNEVHFSSPIVSSSISTNDQYRTAGINIGSLLDFSSSYLLHSKQLSDSLIESSQTISTSLSFTNDSNPSTLIKFTASSGSFGTILNSTTGLPENLLSVVGTSGRGLSFNGFSDSSTDGIFIGSISDNTSGSVTDGTSGIVLSETIGSNSLIIANKNSSSALKGAANIYMYSDGYIGMYAKGGIFYSKTAVLPFELTNKAYVDSSIAAITASNDSKIPLIGNDSSNPITASLYFDITSSTEPSSALKINSLITTEIDSSNPVEFKELSDTSSYQIVRGTTPLTGSDNDFTTRAFVADQIATVVTGTGFVDLISTQTISGQKTFSETQIITHNTPLELDAVSGTSVTINTNANIVSFHNTTASTVKITSDATEDTDSSDTLITKGYLTSFVASQITSPIWANWNLGDTISGILNNKSPNTSSSSFSSYLISNSTLSGFEFLNPSTNTITVRINLSGILFAMNTTVQILLNHRVVTTPSVVAKTYAGSYTLSPEEGPLNTTVKDSFSISSIQTIAPGDAIYFSTITEVPTGFDSNINEFLGQGIIEIISIA